MNVSKSGLTITQFTNGLKKNKEKYHSNLEESRKIRRENYYKNKNNKEYNIIFL